MNEPNAEIQFPREWEYRIFCDSSTYETVQQEAEQRVAEMKLSGLQLADGGVSGSGKYRSLRLTVNVASKDEANDLGVALKSIAGVRFIL